MNENHEFDIHIEYSHRYYFGDSSTDITVIYPSARKDQQPFAKEYDDHYGDLSSEEVAMNAAKDIAEYMQYPERTLAEWIEKSGSDWEQLRELQHDLEHVQKRAESAQKDVIYHQERAQKYRQQIAELETRLNQGARHD